MGKPVTEDERQALAEGLDPDAIRKLFLDLLGTDLHVDHGADDRRDYATFKPKGATGNGSSPSGEWVFQISVSEWKHLPSFSSNF